MLILAAILLPGSATISLPLVTNYALRSLLIHYTFRLKHPTRIIKNNSNDRCWLFVYCFSIGLISFQTKAQTKDSLLVSITLDECLAYAINHQPFVQQAKLDEAITERIIKSKLADWYPQINLVGTLCRFIGCAHWCIRRHYGTNTYQIIIE